MLPANNSTPIPTFSCRSLPFVRPRHPTPPTQCLYLRQATNYLPLPSHWRSLPSTESFSTSAQNNFRRRGGGIKRGRWDGRASTHPPAESFDLRRPCDEDGISYFRIVKAAGEKADACRVDWFSLCGRSSGKFCLLLYNCVGVCVLGCFVLCSMEGTRLLSNEQRVCNVV